MKFLIIFLTLFFVDIRQIRAGEKIFMTNFYKVAEETERKNQLPKSLSSLGPGEFIL